MEEKKIKKKKLTLSVSLKKPYNVSSYQHDRQKKSVVIEKKTTKRWNERKFYSRDNDFNKSKKNRVSVNLGSPYIDIFLSVKIQLAKIDKLEFFDPLICILPKSGFPPFMLIVSIIFR